MRGFFLVVGNPTDDGITLAAIIGGLYAAAPNDGRIEDSASTMTYQKPKPGDRQVQGREQKIEVHPNA